jgi:hypothetical protein
MHVKNNEKYIQRKNTLKYFWVLFEIQKIKKMKYIAIHVLDCDNINKAVHITTANNATFLSKKIGAWLYL